MLRFALKAGYINVTISLVTYVDLTTSPTGTSGPPFSAVTTRFSVAGVQQMSIGIPTGGTPFQHVEARCGDRLNRAGRFASLEVDTRF